MSDEKLVLTQVLLATVGIIGLILTMMIVLVF